MMRSTILTIVSLLVTNPFVMTNGQTDEQTDNTAPICGVNEIFNGKSCSCASGYFMYSDKQSRLRCEDECEEVYYTFFTYGACVSDIYGRFPREQQAQCNLRCGLRVRTLASIGAFLTIAAAIATLIFMLPLCITTCVSCLSARKASKTAKRVYMETQNQPSKEQQLQTLSYNPYAYWPYYGRA